MACALLGVEAMAGQQDAAVPVEAEPAHQTVLLNDYVQAFRVRLAPGASTLMHVHAHPDIAVRLGTSTTTSESPGQPRGAREQSSPGMVTARENAPAPTTHRVHNVGTTVFDVIDVQALQRPATPTAAPIAEPVAENGSMRAYRFELAPGASTLQHTHVRPCLLVAVSAGELHATPAAGSPVRRSVAAGDMEWIEAASTHTLTNVGAEPAILVEIELK